MRRRVRGSMPDQFELNLTPLLDVILQLITFFMMLVHFGTRIEGETRGVRLPVTAAALPSGDLGMDRLVVAMDRRGNLLADGAAQPALWWKEQAKKRREARRILRGKDDDELPTLVVIRADREASYGDVRKALAAAQSSGFAHFSLLVLREDRP